jgi:hypothetical protein
VFAAFRVYFASPIEDYLGSGSEGRAFSASFAGRWAVPLAGLAAAAGLAVNITLAARSAKRTIEA